MSRTNSLLNRSLIPGIEPVRPHSIRRHAPARGGNISVTVCDRLVAIAARPDIRIKNTVRRPYQLPDERDPWEED